MNERTLIAVPDMGTDVIGDGSREVTFDGYTENEALNITRMSRMAEMIRERKGEPMWRSIVSQIIAQSRDSSQLWSVPPKEWMAELEAIYNWVNMNVHYLHSQYKINAMIAPEVTLKNRTGDCDEISIVIGVLAQAAGHPVKLRAVTFDGQTYTHVYPLVGIEVGGEDVWVPMDTVYEKQIGRAPAGVRNPLEVIVE